MAKNIRNNNGKLVAILLENGDIEIVKGKNKTIIRPEKNIKYTIVNETI